MFEIGEFPSLGAGLVHACIFGMAFKRWCLCKLPAKAGALERV